jgi:hypothetical protein
MSREPEEEPCPYCGELVLVTAARCRHCRRRLQGEEEAPPRPRRGAADEDEPEVRRRRRFEDEDEDFRPRRRRPREETTEATDFLIPTNVSGWAIASCYLGLIGFCIPFVGLLFAVPALIFGIIALRKPKRASTYGGVTSNVRAIIGVVLSSLSILGWGGLLIYWLLFIATH